MHQRLMKSSGKPESGPECSVPATGMCRHEVDAGRQVRCHLARDCALHRADVGDDRTRLEMRGDLLRHRAADADGNAEDDEVGVLHGFRIGLDHTVDDAELLTRARVFSERAVVTISCARPCRRAARAIEPPIRPKPIRAMR
jgi:hypothetical protein